MYRALLLAIAALSSNFVEAYDFASDGRYYYAVSEYSEALQLPEELIKSSSIEEGMYHGVKYLAIEVEKNLQNIDIDIETAILDEKPQLSIFINQRRALELYQSKPKVKSFEIKQTDLLSKSTYLDGKRSVRFFAKGDGVVRIPASSIISSLPDFEGSNYGELTLYANGKVKPYYFTGGDSDLSSNDFIYFKGEIVSGDSTYFHFYAPHTTYYLVQNAKDQPQRLEDITSMSSNGLRRPETVRIERHYENDVRYNLGVNVLDPHTAYLEGLYKSEISPLSSPAINILSKDGYSFYLPGLNADASYEIGLSVEHRLKFVEGQGMIEPRPLEVEVYSNESIKNTTNETKDFYRIETGELNVSNSGAGAVSARISNNSTDFQSFTTYLDYVKITGDQRPNAHFDKYSFVSPSSGLFVTIPGFVSEQGISINEQAGTIEFLNSSLSTVDLNYSGASGEKRYIVASLPNYQYSSFQHGYHVVDLSNPIISSGASRLYYRADSLEKAIDNLDSYMLFANPVNMQGQAKVADKQYNFQNGLISAIHIKNGRVVSESINQEKIDATLRLAESGTRTYSVKSRIGGEVSVFGNNTLISGYGFNSSGELSYDKVDYMILTHTSLLPSANQYAEYRRSKGLTSRVVDVQNIYDKYNNGVKEPKAIKSYFSDLYQTGDEPTYAFIIGDANIAGRTDLPQIGDINDFVPTYGFPVSDVWYSYLDGDDGLAEIYLSRLGAHTNDQVMGYLSKVKRYEALGYQEWNKDILTIYDDDEQSPGLFTGLFGPGVHQLNRSPLCTDSVLIVKRLGSGSVSNNQGEDVRREINKGKAWTFYTGHASAQLYAIDGWQTENLNNFGKYGFFSTVACNTGAFAEADVKFSRNEEYVLDSINGFVAATGNTGTGHTSTDPAVVLRALFNVESLGHRSLGQIFSASRNFKNTQNDPLWEYIKLNYNILGDPAVALKIDTITNYQFGEPFDVVSNLGSATIFKEANSAIINIPILNSGLRTLRNFAIEITRSWNGKDTTFIIDNPQICNSGELRFEIETLGMVGEHLVRIALDPANEIIESDKSNNIIDFSFYVFDDSLLPLEPNNGWDVPIENAVFRFLQPATDNVDTESVEFEFIIKDKDENIVISSTEDQIQKDEGYVTWSPEEILLEGESYTVEAFSITDGLSSSPLIISFRASDETDYINEKVTADYRGEDISNRIAGTNYTINQEGSVSPNTNYFNYRVTSRWNKGSTIEGFYGEEEQPYQLMHFNQWGSGFSFFLFDRNNPQAEPIVKVFDTFNTETETDSLITFLKRDVKEYHILVGLTSGNYTGSFNENRTDGWPAEPKDGEFGADTLVTVLARFGIEGFDPIDFRFSNAFVGSYDTNYHKYTVYERLPEEEVVIEGIIKLQEPNSEFSIQLPQKTFDYSSLKLKIENPDAFVEANISNVENTKDILSDLGKTINLDTNSTSGVLNFKTNVDYFETFAFEGFVIEGQAYPEYHISKLSTAVNPDEVLIGDTLNITSKLSNIAIRNNEIPDLQFGINGIIDTRNGIDRTVLLDTMLSTEKFSEIVDFTFSAKEETELYRFNNSLATSIGVNSDTVKPNIDLTLDNLEIIDEMFVSKSPLLKATIYDNSRLPITLETDVDLRLNNRTLDKSQFSVTNYGSAITKKMEIEYTLPDSLVNVADRRANFITMWVKDASGNISDTLDFYFNVATKVTFDSLLVYPNPSVEMAKIKYNIRTPEKNTDTKVKIVDMSGLTVKEIFATSTIGDNIITWDGKNEDGNTVSTGVYYFEISFDSDLYIEPIYGKLQRLR
ncbi:MAG: hypothetical protein Kapaf2KO_13620 [Candidatus Kapaibacteriales bacterium]